MDRRELLCRRRLAACLARFFADAMLANDVTPDCRLFQRHNTMRIWRHFVNL